MFESLPTPAVLIDGDRLQRNIVKAQRRALAAGVVLRPHVKTHRSVEIAARQLQAGACGITCAKPSEAEVFIAAGVDDVRVAYPALGHHRVEHLRTLAQRARLSFCVDTIEGARQVSSVFAQAPGSGVKVDSQVSPKARVLLKIDCGYGRAGWEWRDPRLAETARDIAKLPGIEILGVLTHAGQAYAGPEAGEDAVAALRQHARHERDRTQAAAEVVGDALGVADGNLEVSIGSTPTFWHFEKGDPVRFPVTELRPGNYVFHDLTQVALGASSLDDCALTVLATVVSAREREGKLHALIDAGKKVFTSDQRVGQQGFGLVLRSCDMNREINDGDSRLEVEEGLRLHALSEEHGWIEAPLEAGLTVGQRVRVLVNHSCVVVSTQRRLVEVRGTEIVGSIAVDAAGCSV